MLVEEVEYRTSYIKLFWFLNQYHLYFGPPTTRAGTLFIVTTYIFLVVIANEDK